MSTRLKLFSSIFTNFFTKYEGYILIEEFKFGMHFDQLTTRYDLNILLKIQLNLHSFHQRKKSQDIVITLVLAVAALSSSERP